MNGSGGDDSVTVQILRSIRDEVAKTNERIDVLRVETTGRLDHLTEAHIRLATEVAGLRGEVVELRTVVTRNGERFEHFLDTEGNTVRDLRQRVERLEAHAGIELKPRHD